MQKEGQIIEMLGEVAEQSTRQILETEDRLRSEAQAMEGRLRTEIKGVEKSLRAELGSRVSRLDTKIDNLGESLRQDMRELRNENATFHDEIVGFLRRAEQEPLFTSEHLRRHDEQIADLYVRIIK